jgi:peptidyl-prolyl cis-trans isomerase D
MLKTLRDQFKHLKWILWFVVFLFVFFIFVDWGTGRARTRGLAGLAARVGSVSISEAQFLQEMRNTEQRYRSMYGDQYDKIRDQLDLASMTIQNMVDRYLLLEEARRMGLEVTDKELLAKIMSFPSFKRSDGSFVGEDLYGRILRANQTSPEEFEDGLRQELMLGKLQQVLAAGIVIPDPEVEQEYRRRNETASFEVLFVPATREPAGLTVTDADAKAYYDAHQARFSHPAQRQLRYLLVDDTRLRRTLTVPETQISEYYASHQQEFQQPEEVNARHILIRPKTQDDAGWQDAQNRAREVSSKVRAPGADFAALARQYSEDPGSKDSGGELGWFPRGRMVKEFEDAAFRLSPGEVSEPIKSQFGYHILKLEGRKPGGLKTLAEVHELIRERLLEGLADAEGNRRATALREKIDAAKLTTDEQWHTLADDVVTSNMTPFFSQEEVIPGIGRDPELLGEVASAKEGFVGGPRRSTRGWIVYRVAKARPAGVTPYAEAKDEAREAVKRVKSLEALQRDIEAKRGTLATGPLGAQAAGLGGAVQTVTDHHRDASITGVGVSRALDDAVFSTPVNTLTPVVAVGERGVAVARVTAAKPFDRQAYAKEKAALRDSLAKEEMNRMLVALLAEAKRARPVVINTEVVDRFKPRRG